jgi:hypothetical protein
MKKKIKREKLESQEIVEYDGRKPQAQSKEETR